MTTYQTAFDEDEDKLARANANYRGLWASVLLQAVRDLDSKEDTERQPAIAYVSDSELTPGSFNWICESLELDTERVRLMTFTRSGRRKLLGRNIGNTKQRTEGTKHG